MDELNNFNDFAKEDDSYVEITLSGLAEVFYLDSVVKGKEIEIKDFDPRRSLLEYDYEDELVDGRLLEIQLIYKMPVITIQQAGHESIEIDDEDEVRKHIINLNWFGARYSSYRRQSIISLMNDGYSVDQTFKIPLNGKEFDLNKLNFINVSGDDLISQFEPEGWLLSEFIIYDNKAIQSEDPSYYGICDCRYSILLDGASDFLGDDKIEWEDEYVDFTVKK